MFYDIKLINLCHNVKETCIESKNNFQVLQVVLLQ